MTIYQYERNMARAYLREMTHIARILVAAATFHPSPDPDQAHAAFIQLLCRAAILRRHALVSGDWDLIADAADQMTAAAAARDDICRRQPHT